VKGSDDQILSGQPCFLQNSAPQNEWCCPAGFHFKMNRKAAISIFFGSLILILVGLIIGYWVKAIEGNGIEDYVEDGEFKGVPVVFFNSTSIPVDGVAPDRFDGFECNGVIYINNERTAKHQKEALFHEHGHIIWYYVITQKERDDYAEIYAESEKYVSEIAREGGVKEDFAETYRYLMLYDHSPEDRRNFFKDLVKKYPDTVSV